MRTVISYRFGAPGIQWYTPHGSRSGRYTLMTSSARSRCTGFTERLIFCSPNQISVSISQLPSSSTLVSYSARIVLFERSGVSFIPFRYVSGTVSSHTVFQMPVVCTYQQPKFSGAQRCFPRGCSMLQESSTFTVRSFAPVWRYRVISKVNLA